MSSEWDRMRAGIGKTRLLAATRFGKRIGVPNLHLKDETQNPGGFLAARLALAEVEAALAAQAPKIATASEGTFAPALAYVAKAARLPVVVYVPESRGSQWAAAAEARGATVVRYEGDFVETVDAARKEAASQGWHDATPASPATTRRFAAYEPVSAEILEGLGRPPDVVAVPTRDGSAITGIHQGFRALQRARKISTLPKLLASTTKAGNPIAWSLAERHDTCQDLDEREVWRSDISEALSTHHAFDGTAAMHAVRDSGGWAYAASDEDLQGLAAGLKEVEGVEASPAALAGVAALRFAAQFGKLGGHDAHVAVLTARA